MKFVTLAFLVAFLSGPVLATEAATAPAPDVRAVTPSGLELLDAADVSLSEFVWVKRVVAVFADTPNDPQFQQQIRMLEGANAGLLDRDVVVVVDTDPAARSEVRQQLRPRGFSLVLLDKDGAVKQRKPNPWTAREIFHAIDRLPLRREEMLQQRPGRVTN
ncbi:DUF4174 domain-containing protein [Plastorhodobacter daqingensis]|uniref:DUF4174 domain-containing protein n=1 Tax=Plastorhodobacter daqingensis TaxID=1387281 RepID=A0ABW2UKS5_9RHOB